MIPESTIQEIRDRADIVALIARDVPDLKKRGRIFSACCPFHAEKTPSFVVTPARRTYHCFGCSAGGDAIRWRMAYHDESFQAAVRVLAAELGVELPDERPESEDERRRRLAAASQRDRLLRLNDGFAALCSTTLAGPAGGAARAYLAQRQIDAQAVAEFRLGACPGTGAFARWLEEAAHTPEDVVTAGLVSEPEGGWTSGPLGGGRFRFRGRLMFPIVDGRGEVAGFTGRALAESPAKYLNSPESPVFTKGAHLYGIHLARAAARRAGFVALVEGNVDTIRASRQVPTVGAMGTALTAEQAAALARLAPRVVVVMDGDAAGRRAAVAHLGPLLDAGLDVRVVVLPLGADPDTWILGGGDLGQACEAAEPLLGWVIRTLAEGATSPEAAAAAGATLRGLLSKVREPIAAEAYAAQAAEALGVGVHHLLTPLALNPRTPKTSAPSLRPLPAPGGRLGMRRSDAGARALAVARARRAGEGPDSETWAASIPAADALAVARALATLAVSE